MKCSVESVKMDYLGKRLLRKTNGKVADFRYYECKECGKQEYKEILTNIKEGER